MVDRDDRRRGVERRRFGTYEGEGGEHEPREYHYGRGFDKPERGRWSDQYNVEVFSGPYDQWTSPGYVFYAGKGYHREFIDPYALREPEGFEAEDVGPIGGTEFPPVRERPRRGRFTGRGPKGYAGSDERLREEVSERLTEHGEIDATEITVRVSRRVVTLEGAVEDRPVKRLAEDVAASVRGVLDVQNDLRIAPGGTSPEHVDVRGPASRSGTGFLTENREVRRPRSR